MIDDQPIMGQLEQLMYFCNNHKYIYVYGCGEEQELVVKYLTISDVKVEGYIASTKNYCDKELIRIPIYTLDEMFRAGENNDDIGIIMALSDRHYNEVLRDLKEKGFEDFRNIYFITEYNKRTIAHKMRPRKKDMFWLEVNLVDHCNLNCQMCDHFSPIACETFLDLETFTKDMKRLAELSGGEIGRMKLQGGEPLLHDDINDFIKITRYYFPKTELYLFTNGILLLKKEKDKKGNLWKICKDCDVEIQLTQYPINLNFQAIEDKAKEYGVKLIRFMNAADRKLEGVKFSVKHPFDLSGNQEHYRFISCYQFNESITLKDGKIYTCPIIPYVNHFNDYFNQNLEITKEDYIDIYKAKSYEELAEFVTKRVPFCRYCDVKNRTSFEWKQSERSINEWT